MPISNVEQNNENGGLRNQSDENLHLLLDSIKSFNIAEDLKLLLEESMEAVRLVMKSEASTLMLVDGETGKLNISLSTGPVKEEVEDKSIPSNRGIGGWVLQNREPYFSNDPQNSDIFWGEVAEDFKTKNIICVPLINDQDEAIGVLEALNKEDDKDFDSDDIPIFQALASHVTVAIERIRELQQFREKLEKKELILTELHHRVKNNLTMLAVLIDLELPNTKDDHSKQILKITSSRLQAMTEIHALLYQREVKSQLNLGDYLTKLVSKISPLISDITKPIDTTIKPGSSISISADRAMLCGMILSELLINAYKHAFTQTTGISTINVDLSKTKEGQIQLEVSDNGQGLDNDFSFENSESAGVRLIKSMSKQLRATIDLPQSEGTCFQIRFPQHVY